MTCKTFAAYFLVSIFSPKKREKKKNLLLCLLVDIADKNIVNFASSFRLQSWQLKSFCNVTKFKVKHCCSLFVIHYDTFVYGITQLILSFLRSWYQKVLKWQRVANVSSSETADSITHNYSARIEVNNNQIRRIMCENISRETFSLNETNLRS